jgi:hypothetical protein
VKTFLIAVACVLLATSARAQDPRLRGALDGETLARVSRLIDSARTESLPVDPLVGVALEGAQRHAPGPRIARAVQDYLSSLRSARVALGSTSTTSEIVSGAGVLLSGVPGDVLRQLRAASPSRPLTVPLVVLADLIARGVPKDTAAAVIARAAHANARDDDYSALRRFVEQDIIAGASPASAAMLRVRGITGVPPGTEPSTPEKQP